MHVLEEIIFKIIIFNFSFSLIATTASRPNFGCSFLGLALSYMLFSCSLSFWRFSCLVFCNCSLAEAVSDSLFSAGKLGIHTLRKYSWLLAGDVTNRFSLLS